MITSGLIHFVLDCLHIPIHIRDICVFLAPIFSGLTAFATYLLTKELWNEKAGLFSAIFIAIAPGYISRSVAGSYDNEGIAIFALMFTYYLWIKAVKTGTVLWGALTALSYFYMVSAWGGYVFIINLIPLHVLFLILMGRYSNRIYVAYNSFYILGLLCSMQIPFVGFQPIRTSEHMASAGIFLLLNAIAALKYVQSSMTKSEFKLFFFTAVLAAAGVVFTGIFTLTYLGYIAPWTGRFYSLWDTGYAKIHIPIIASVSEHQPTTWSSFFFDLHLLVPTFPMGLWYCIKHVNDERVFIALYAITASYFAGVMVRLMLTLTPVVCVLSAIAFSECFTYSLQEDGQTKAGKKRLEDESTSKPDSKEAKGQPSVVKKPKKSDLNKEDLTIGSNLKTTVSLLLIIMLMLFVLHCTWVTSNAYSSPSIVLASYSGDGNRVILDDFREAYYWLAQNTDDDARVMSWWDYVSKYDESFCCFLLISVIFYYLIFFN